MTISRMNPKVDGFLRKAKSWKEEFEALRTIVLDSDLTEDFKWMHPCYTFQGKNIVLIHGFKEYCALLFHKDEAIEVEKAGLQVEYKKTTEYTIPEQLQNKFVEIPDLKTAFEALTPGRQRAYLFHFSEPKQSKTRESRIEKYLPHILDGKGLND
ncbi:YdeI/OmpD-associated family protein [Paenibacillus arenilitoris]|uniref:YdeI/OmpD-associated family protein n=1 Tax=Paenibacillus arenilitoris TaxID=2772299 RepID=A0A927H8W7_9BACL|nr:YdeI/OmpD-associated family protein [Paenibacillus arenilitoris]MBD2872495.1 YdeI/OmpD-associated family protein [Paenibacillus arenilitoris]